MTTSSSTSSSSTMTNTNTTTMTTIQNVAEQFAAARNRIATGETKNIRRDDPRYATYFERLDFYKMFPIDQLRQTVNVTPYDETGIDALIEAVANVAHMNDMSNSDLANAFDELQQQNAFDAFVQNPVYSPVDLLIFASERLETIRNPRSQRVLDYLDQGR